MSKKRSRADFELDDSPSGEESVEEGEMEKILKWRYHPRVPVDDKLRGREYLVKRHGIRKSRWESMESLVGVENMGVLHEDLSPTCVDGIHTSLLKGHIPCSWTVEHIVAERSTPDGFEFLVKWTTFPDNYNSWEPYANVSSCMECISDFRRKENHPNPGAAGFDRHYWDRNYPKEWLPYMDGSSNSLSHALRIYWFLHTYGISNEVQSIAEFGFGKGWMLESFAMVFHESLERVYGIEPSTSVFKEFLAGKPHERRPFHDLHLQLECCDLESFVRSGVHVIVLDDDKQKEHDGVPRDLWVNDQSPSQFYDVDLTSSHLLHCGFVKSEHKQKPDEYGYNPALLPTYCAENIDLVTAHLPYDDEPVQKRRRVSASSGETSRHDGATGSDGDQDDEKMRDPQEATQKRRSTRKRRKARNIDADSVYYTGSAQCECEPGWEGVYSLGIFSSVAQYMNDEALELVFNRLSYLCEYLYFDVPTKEEYKTMKSGAKFVDQYSIQRTQQEYLDMVQKDWTIVSCGLLESKVYFDSKTTSVGSAMFRM